MKTTHAAFVAAMLFAVPAMGHAACTEDDQAAKVDRLGNLLTALAQTNATKAGTITQALAKAMVLEGDAACVELDRLIAAAK